MLSRHCYLKNFNSLILYFGFDTMRHCCYRSTFDTRDLVYLLSNQTKFVAIILVLLVSFLCDLSLTDVSSDAFDFSSSQTRETCSAQLALIALRAF